MPLHFLFGEREKSSLSLMQYAILVKDCLYLSSTANEMTPLHPVLLMQHVDRLELLMAQSELLCLFPIYRARMVYKHVILWSAKQRARGAREEQFDEFD